EGRGKALGGFQIAGVRTNLGFLQRLAAHADVHAGQIDTGYIERRLPELLTPEAEFSDPRDLAAAVAAVLSTEAPAEETSPWDLRDGFSLAAIRARPLVLNGTMARLRYHRDGMILEGAGTDFGFRFATRPDRWLDVFLGDRKEVVGAVRFGREFEVTTPRGR